MLDDNSISICFYTEKKEGHGEDAPPLLTFKENICAVGVFDGMGGAGAAVCRSDYGDGHTKAYVASRIVKESIESLLDNCLGQVITPDLLKDKITARLREEQVKYPVKEQMVLRSKLVRDYPTTMALVTVINEESKYLVNSYWAGDSRCYLWTKDGFCQISKDDLEENNDPMDNLKNDSAISNCISSDRDFKINHLSIDLTRGTQFAVLCATDGCFGYYPSPMDLECTLLDCLNESNSAEGWKQSVVSHIQDITGDDTSLSLIAIGFKDYEGFRHYFKGYSPKYDRKRINKLRNDVLCSERQLNRKKKKYEEEIKLAWEQYKKIYMRHIGG